MQNDILITSGDSFEGYDITGYLGHESTHIVFGTTFMNSINARLTDLIEENGISDNTDKMDAAEESAKKLLMNKVIQAGGNAIIGIVVDYTICSNNLMLIVVKGTAVRVERKPDASRCYSFNNRLYNTALPIRCSTVDVLKKPTTDTIQLKISGSMYLNSNAQALIANVTFKNVFNEDVVIKNVVFPNLTIAQDHTFTSEPVLVSSKPIELSMIEAVFVDVTKYRLDSDIIKVDSKLNEKIELADADLSEIKRIYGSDAVMNAIDEGESWTCYCGKKNDMTDDDCSLCGRSGFFHSEPENEEYLSQLSFSNHYSLLETMKNARDIYEYLLKLEPANNNDVVFGALMLDLKKLVEQERSYGSLRRTALQKIRNTYDITQ